MKIISLVLFLIIATSASALKSEVNIKKPSGVLPDINVIKENGLAVWTMYKYDRPYSVMLHQLNLNHANLLLKYSDEAQTYYKEIIKAGRCPSGKISSGKFGEIQNGKDSDKAVFEVVCENNKIKLNIIMMDRHVINYSKIKTEPKHLKLFAQRLIAELKKV